jgi:hypothetical protein
MARVLRCGFTFCGESFAGTLILPDRYFTAEGLPITHEIFSRLSAHPNITLDAKQTCKEAT